MSKKALLFLNGEEPSILPNMENYTKIFCTDGAYCYLKKLNIQPDIVSGDFDSIDSEAFSDKIEFIATPDQNDTDFIKILKIIVERKFESVDVFGASGKEQDHFLGNLNAAFRFKDDLKITFFDNYSTYFFSDKKNTLTGCFGRTISLLPFPTCKDIKTKGLQYQLNKENLDILSRIGTRNKAIDDEVRIEFTKGNLIIFILHEDFPILLA